MNHFPIILVLLVAVVGCKYLRPEQKIASEAADATPIETINDTRIKLNIEPAGTLTNLAPLKQKIAEIMRFREANGVFRFDSNETENTIFVNADPKINISRLAELALAINENGGKASFLNQARRKTFFDRPNPLFLVVETEGVSKEIFLYTGFSDDADFAPAFRFIESKNELKVARINQNSIEISADDNYFINEKINIMPDSDTDIIDVKQSAISASDLQTELSKIVSGETKLRIIASEKGSYAGLLKVFEAAEKLNVDFEVLVRKHDLKTAAKITTVNTVLNPTSYSVRID